LGQTAGHYIQMFGKSKSFIGITYAV